MTQDFRNTILMPTLAFLAVNLLLSLSAGDLLLADLLYQLEGGSWALEDAWITNAFIHDQGRNLVAVALLTLLTAIALTYISAPLRPYRKGFYYVLVSALITVAIVNLMKEYSTLDCPWSLSRYGGDKAYVSLFGARIEGQSPGGCFPAGHASGAYCWLGLFFLARLYRPRWRFRVLAAVMGTGVIFGIAQQLRGAHFISHDVWTLYISWMSAALCYYYLFRLENLSDPRGSLAKIDP